MKQGFTSHHFTRSRGWKRPDDPSSDEVVPMGGHTFGIGFSISWQNGPLGRGVDRTLPNGAFVEDIIDAARDRIEHYQTLFPCAENDEALEHLRAALTALDRRTKDREARKVEGTHAR